MKYATPYDIGIGDDVRYKGKDYLVFINYIKGETDAKGYTPNANRTILIDNNDTEITRADGLRASAVCLASVIFAA